MKSIRTLAFVLTITACFGVGSRAPAVPGLSGGSGPTVFAPGVVSGMNVFRGTFSADGRELYFFKKTTTDPRLEEYRIFVTRWNGTEWSVPDTVDLGESPSDLYPAISPDGARLVFSSYRPAPGDTSGHPSAYLWMSERTEDGWSTPRFLARASLYGHYHSQVAFRPDGTLTFKRLTHDYRNQAGDWQAAWVGDTYLAEPDTVAAHFRSVGSNLHLYETSPTARPDQILLIIGERDADGRPGAGDLWMAELENGRWNDPCRLAAGVNTPATENFPFFSPDGRYLFFVRDFNQILYVEASAAMRCDE